LQQKVTNRGQTDEHVDSLRFTFLINTDITLEVAVQISEPVLIYLRAV